MSNVYALESPIDLVEGAKITYTLTYVGVTAITGTPTVVAYYNGSDESATVFPSGSVATSGNTVTWKEFVAASAYAGGRIVVVTTATADTNTDVRKVIFRIVKASEDR